MDLRHRKLITDTVTINVTALCEPFCDPKTKSTDAYCPDLCFYNCPQACFITYPPLIPPPEDDPIKTHHPNSSQKVLRESLAVSLSILGIACFIYCLCSIYKHCKNRGRGRSPIQGHDRTRDRDEFFDEDRGPILDHPIWYIRTLGLQPSVINLIAACKYRRGEGLIEGTECSVCLSEFEDDETLRLLPKCNHAFHLSCIDTWLRSHTNCPLCRAPIVANPNGTLSPVLQRSTEGNSAVADEEEEEEENPVVIREGSRGNSDLESRIGIVLKGIGSSEQGGRKDKEKSMRRSVSMDSSSASTLVTAIANAPSGSRLGESDGIHPGSGVVPRENRDPSPSLQRSSVARSFSCSRKVPSSMNNRTHALAGSPFLNQFRVPILRDEI